MDAPQPPWSDDGQWWWDGQQWRPAADYRPPPPSLAWSRPVAQPPRITSRRHGRRRRWPWLVLLCLVGLAAGAWIASTGAPRNSQVSAARPPTLRAPAAPVIGSCEPQPCAYADSGWIATIDNVDYGADPHNGAQRPAAGNVFVTMTVRFSNRSGLDQVANPGFVLVDGAGAKRLLMATTGCPTWEAENVPAGAGFGPKCLAFQAAQDRPAGLTLIWTPYPNGADYRIRLT